MIWNSEICPLFRPVSVTIGAAVVPLATNVPPVVSNVVPLRISQVAPVTVVHVRLLEKTSVTFHPVPVTLKLSYTLANWPDPMEVSRSLGMPLTRSKSPLYQSAVGVAEGVAVPVGVDVGFGVGVCGGVGVGVGGKPPPNVVDTSLEGGLSSPTVLYAVTMKKYVSPSAKSETVAPVVFPTSICWG